MATPQKTLSGAIIPPTMRSRLITMTYYTRYLLLSLLLMPSLALALHTAAPQHYQWVSKRQPQNPEQVSTFVAKVDGYAVKAFKGIVHMPYSVDQVTRLLMDHQRLPEWIYQSQKVTENIIPDSQAFLYQFDGIWPVNDRDVVMDYEYTQDKQSRGTRLHVVNVANVYPKHEDYVRIPLLDNRWHMFPVKPGWTEVQFETFIDIGGRVPKWIANIVANDAPRRTLKGMRKMLDTGDYGPPTAQTKE